jgi:hypothetical protein
MDGLKQKVLLSMMKSLFLTPANYQIRLDSIINITLEDDYKQSNDFLLFLKQSNNIINIYTLRGRFTEQA